MASSDHLLRIAITILAVLFVLLQYKLWLSDSGWPEVLALDEAVTKQSDENVRMTFKNRALEAEVRDLKQGLDAVEERARSNLGMIGRNETYYQVSAPQPDKSKTGDDTRERD
ncbi:MAG: cell division protein FtsB [Gammaproteobacteria bacterium]